MGNDSLDLQNEVISILFKPGHYDLVYKDESFLGYDDFYTELTPQTKV